MTEALQLSREELVRAVRSHTVPREQPFTIRCDAADCIAKRDVLELLLAIQRAAPWRWEDPAGRAVNGASATGALWRVARDAVAWPVLLHRARATVRSHTTAGRRPAVLRDASRALYLRTDHWFNVTSGGSVGHVRGVIDGLRAHGVETQVLSSDHLVGVAEDERFHLCRPHYRIGRNVPELPELEYNHRALACAESLLPLARPGFVYQRYSLGNHVGAALRQRHGLPFVCEYNGSFPWMARQWDGRRLLHERLLTEIELLNLRAADLVVVVSEPMRAELVRRGIESDKVLVNPNGVDEVTYSPDVDGGEVRSRLGLGDRLVFGFIGSFGRWHGAEVLAEAYGRLLVSRPELRNATRLLLVGDGATMPAVRAAVDRHGAGGQIVLTGRVPQAQGPAHLAACDVLVSPHVPNPDGTPFFGSPTKLFEYMAMGRAIVASDLDQIGEVLAHGETAWLVRPGDAEALAQGLAAVAADASLRERLGAAARVAAVARHTWKAHVARILAALQERCA